MLLDSNTNILISIILATIILIGFIANLLNVIVFSTKSMRLNSTFRYLFYLSIVDFLVLLTSASDSLLAFDFLITIRLKSNLTCKIHTFLVYFLTHLSSGILMIVNINRVFSMKQNNNFKGSISLGTNNNLNKVGKTILILSLILVLINFLLKFYQLI